MLCWQGVSVIMWSLATLRHDVPDTYEALAARALQQLQTPAGRAEMVEPVRPPALINE